MSTSKMHHGVWEGILDSPSGPPPELQVTWHGDVVAGVTLAEDADSTWRLRVPIPVEAISDGVQTFLVVERGKSTALTSFALCAGEPLAEDLRAEVALLRAELDMLKRAFRRHCGETGAD
ncbi:MAG: hypothetical protein AAF092_17660 [Pseudomonadota bacterium]